VTSVAPPDQTVWWDETAIADAVYDVLRLSNTDVDAERIADLVQAAGGRVNDWLDRVDPLPAPTPGPVFDALIQVVVAMYERKDSQPSSVDGLIAAAWRPQSVDPLAAVREQLRPYRQRLGFA
jgi:hypothetical protein